MASQHMVWIVGPIAWDSVVYLEQPIRIGGFSQGVRFEERAGGTGANVARALASTKVPVEFVGYVGDDDFGSELKRDLIGREIGIRELRELSGPTSHVQIAIEPGGERIILGLAPDRLEAVDLLKADIVEGDTVVFVLWREHFISSLEYAKAKGARVVVGLGALTDPRVVAEVAIGSEHDLPSGLNFSTHNNRFEKIVVTRGIAGIDLFVSGSVSEHFSSEQAKSVDATGAGDSFLAGFIFGIIDHRTLADAIKLGAQWAATSVEIEGSIPADFERVRHRFSI
jgi:sugar/nucleoside kinase (ribokinase family)